jgi:uncharacterized protein (TIGR02646 family)
MVKVERSFPAPDSLAEEKQKVNGSYSKPDVIERLAKDFHNKCYICELDKLQDPQVEHLRPHFGGKDIDRKFDWNNLFWSCSHCNGVKNQRKYDESIIDCCKSDPEARIYFKLHDGKTDVTAVNLTDSEARITAELVTEVFNLKNSGMRVYKSALRFEELNREMNKFYDTLDELAQNPKSGFALKKLKALIRKESRFAAFKRCYIRENEAKYIEYL